MAIFKNPVIGDKVILARVSSEQQRIVEVTPKAIRVSSCKANDKDKIITEYCKFTDRVARDDSLVILFAQHIADIAIAAERESCAKACDYIQIIYGECPGTAEHCAEAIRSRSEVKNEK